MHGDGDDQRAPERGAEASLESVVGGFAGAGRLDGRGAARTAGHCCLPSERCRGLLRGRCVCDTGRALALFPPVPPDQPPALV